MDDAADDLRRLDIDLTTAAGPPGHQLGDFFERRRRRQEGNRRSPDTAAANTHGVHLVDLGRRQIADWLLAKWLTVREAAMRLKIGKTALYAALNPESAPAC